MIAKRLSSCFCYVQIAHFDKNKGSIPFLERIRIEPEKNTKPLKPKSQTRTQSQCAAMQADMRLV